MKPTPGSAADAVTTPRRDLRGVTVLLVILALVFGGLAVSVVPADSLRLLGATEEVQATVVSSKQTGRAWKNRGNHYEVTVRWQDDGVTRIGTDNYTSRSSPPSVGSTIPVHVARFGSDISVQGRAAGMVWSIGTLVTLIGLLVLGLIVEHRRRRWGRLAEYIITTAPRLATVRTYEAPRRANHPATLGLEVDDPVGTVSAKVRLRDKEQPIPGDVLQVWSPYPGRRGPSALRRESDGLWWSFTGKNPQSI